MSEGYLTDDSSSSSWSPIMTTATMTLSNSTPGMINDGGDLAYTHKQILFTMVAVIYVLCAALSITSFKEIPLDMLDKPMSVRMKTSGTSGGENNNNNPSSSSHHPSPLSNMKYKRMNEEGFEDDFEWERRMGDDIDAISIDRVEFRTEKPKTGAIESIKWCLTA